ncbi:hypothetical protein [Dietzia sp. E1]|uniref:hypothetical protein n=1 Tax=Dietzia sp. E1 TaxID=328361 RepID=UPI0032200D83
MATGRAGLGVGGSATGGLWSVAARVSLAARYGATRRDSGRRLRSVLAACGLPATARTRVMKSDSDTLVVAVTAREGDCALKVSTSDASDRNLARHVDAAATLQGIGDAVFARLLPQILEQTTFGGRTVVRETLLPGRALGADSARAALAAIGGLHSAIARLEAVTPPGVGGLARPRAPCARGIGARGPSHARDAAHHRLPGQGVYSTRRSP